ncbi:MAG: efflux RND transporter periplasmic adaptor subunit [Armatimonadetes bacterium]|nr:efflux RND transporter periplasmic adaptor subunit [Armatimonadota bacterium]
MNHLRTLYRKRPVVAGLAVLALAAVVVAVARRSGSERSPAASSLAAAASAEPAATGARTVAEGQAGTVGDLTVTEEAMQLAEIRVEPVTRQVVPEKLAVSGSIEAGGDRTAKVTPRVGGKATRVLVVAGDTVRAGQTLALLESRELAQAQAAYRQAAARLSVARSHLERQRKLAALGAFGRPKVEDARMQSAAAEGEANTARGEVAASRNEVAEARSEKAALEGEVASAQSDAASAGSEVAEAEGNIQALQAALTQAQAQAKVSRARLERADLLLKEQLVARQEWEQIQADQQRAEADVDAARAGITQGKAKIETMKARLRAAEAKVRAARGRVQQADARIETALAKQAQAEAKLAAAVKRGGIGAQALAREEAVYKGGYVTSREVVEAESALQQAQLEQQSAAQAVRLLGSSPGGGSVLAVTAPISGRVQERNVTLGETVDTEHPIFALVDLAQVWAQLAVTPRDLPRVRVGQRVELTADTSGGRVFVGSVSAIGSAADESTLSVRVRVSLANPGAALRPGSFVRGSLITDVRREQIVVPTDAIQEHTGRKTLYVALDKPGAFEVRHVTLGASGEGWREITEGLKGSERVAVSGTFYLKSEALKSQLSDGCCAVETGKE